MKRVEVGVAYPTSSFHRMVRTRQKYKSINNIMADNSEVTSTLQSTVTVEGLTEMIAATRTSNMHDIILITAFLFNFVSCLCCLLCSNYSIFLIM